MTGVERAPEVRLPRWLWRIIQSDVSSYVLLGLAVALPAFGGLEMSGRLRVTLIALGGLCAVGEAVRTNHLRKRRETLAQTARKAAEDAVAELSLLLGTLVQPITELLGEIAAARPRAQRQELAGRLIEKIVDAASGICGPNDVGSTRAVYFELKGDQLRFVTHHGREQRPRSELPAGSVALAKSRKAVLVPDVSRAPRPEDFAEASYRTFISCPVYAGGDLHGLLTVDAVPVGTLKKHDLRTGTVLAHLLGAGLSMANGRK